MLLADERKTTNGLLPGATMHLNGLIQIISHRGGQHIGLHALNGNDILQKIVAWFVAYPSFQLSPLILISQVGPELLDCMGPVSTISHPSLTHMFSIPQGTHLMVLRCHRPWSQHI